MNAQYLDIVSDLVDDIALDKALDWESYNYENVKKLSVLGAAQSYIDIEELDVDETSKKLSLMSVIAYLMMENTILWIDNTKMSEHIMEKRDKLH